MLRCILALQGTVEGVVVVRQQLEFKEFQSGSERVFIQSIRGAGLIFIRFVKVMKMNVKAV